MPKFDECYVLNGGAIIYESFKFFNKCSLTVDKECETYLNITVMAVFEYTEFRTSESK